MYWNRMPQASGRIRNRAFGFLALDDFEKKKIIANNAFSSWFRSKPIAIRFNVIGKIMCNYSFSY